MDNYWTRRARISRRRFVGGSLAGAAGAAALLGVGCGDDDSAKTPAASSTFPGTITVSTASAAASPSASQAPKDFLSSIPLNPPDPIAEKDFKSGGSINRITDRPFQFDIVSGGSTASAGATVGSIYNRLVRYGTRANMKSVTSPDIQGDLAQSWEQPDETTVVFQLYPNIKWANQAPLNGRALTVDDLKYHFKRGATHPKSGFKQFYNLVSSVDDAGGGKVRLKLSQAAPQILDVLTYDPFLVVPPEIGDSDPITTAVGTGPFIMTSATPNVAVVYKKNPDYFRKDSTGRQLPYLDGYTYTAVADVSLRESLLEGGKADCVYQQSTPLTFDNVEEVVKRHPNLIGLQSSPQVAPFFSVAGHWTKPPWNDVRVRRALNLLMDRETIMKSIHRGQSYVGPFVPWSAIFDELPALSTLGANYKYDPKAAKELLSAAGVANLEVELVWYVSQTNEAILTIYQQAAQQVGIKLNLVKSTDVGAHNTIQLNKSWKDLILFAKSASFNDATATIAYLQKGSGQNFSETDDPDLNALHDRLQSARGAERKAATKQLWDRHLDQIYEVMLPQPNDLYWWNLRMHNWRNNAFSSNVGHGEIATEAVWVSA